MKYKDDPYQTEYAVIQDVEILREGTWNWFDYDRAFMEDIAATYDPAVQRAKIIQDHAYGGPAHGHVLALRVEDDPTAEGAYHLVATSGFLPEGKEMVDSGKWNERSMGWAMFHPTPGIPYLWEFSLLGANTPAVSGMSPIIFQKEDSEKMFQQLAIDMANEGAASTEKLSWERDEEYIHYRIRLKSRFADKSIKSVEMDAEAGILARVGHLRREYLGETDPKALVVQSLQFIREKGWTLAKAKAWVGARQLSALNIVINAVVPYQDLALADEEMDWDNDAAESRRREWAGGEDDIDWDKYRQAFLWYDSEDKEAVGGYKLPIADVVDGSLKAVPKGIFAAAGAVSGARGGVDLPEGDLAGVKTHLEKYYAKMDRKAPWQEDSISSSPQGAANISSDSNSNEGGNAAMTEVSKETEVKETPETMVVVEAGATADLSKRANALRIEKEKQDREAQVRLTKEIAELKSQAEASRYESIKSQVRTMQAEGYIASQQVEMGLSDALAAIPDIEILVGDKKRFARDILIDALRYGGKLKLKLEIAKDILEGNTDDPLAKARARGIDTSVAERVQKLMADDPKLTEAKALDKAYREVKR